MENTIIIKVDGAEVKVLSKISEQDVSAVVVTLEKIMSSLEEKTGRSRNRTDLDTLITTADKLLMMLKKDGVDEVEELIHSLPPNQNDLAVEALNFIDKINETKELRKLLIEEGM